MSTSTPPPRRPRRRRRPPIPRHQQRHHHYHSLQRRIAVVLSTNKSYTTTQEGVQTTKNFLTTLKRHPFFRPTENEAFDIMFHSNHNSSSNSKQEEQHDHRWQTTATTTTTGTSSSTTASSTSNCCAACFNAEGMDNVDGPCRGTMETCQNHPNGKEDGESGSCCCWRYTYRQHLEDAYQTGGFMIQLVDLDGSPAIYTTPEDDDDEIDDEYNVEDEYSKSHKQKKHRQQQYALDSRQQIEMALAAEVGVKVFRICRPRLLTVKGEQILLDFHGKHIHGLVRKIEEWYRQLLVLEQRLEEEEEGDEEAGDKDQQQQDDDDNDAIMNVVYASRPKTTIILTELMSNPQELIVLIHAKEEKSRNGSNRTNRSSGGSIASSIGSSVTDRSSQEEDEKNVLNFVAYSRRVYRAVVLQAVKKSERVLRYVRDDLLSDREIVVAAISEYPMALRYAPPHFRADKDIVLAAVQKRGAALELASMRLKGDKDVVLAAVNKDNTALSYASDVLKTNKDFILDLVKILPNALEYASDELKADKEVALAAVCRFATAMQDVADSLASDRDFVLQVVSKSATAFMYARAEFRADKEIALVAVERNPELLKLALGGLAQDRDCWIAAGLWSNDHEKKRKLADTARITLSTRYSLQGESTSSATAFTQAVMKHKYFRDRNFAIYSPNAFCKGTCDPKWTRMSWPCRGTFESCSMDNPSMKLGRPQSESCWRYSFRWHLEESKRTNGFMIQVVDLDGNPKAAQTEISEYELGKGQKIESIMAADVGAKIFKVYRPRILDGGYQYLLPFEERHIDIVAFHVQNWYDTNCFEREECEIRFMVDDRWGTAVDNVADGS